MNRDEFETILAAHYKAHRALEPQDVYKLIYQRVFGQEHLLAPVSPVLCRVNLQPFVQGGGSVEVLWRLFRQTVREYQPGTLVDLERQWRRFLVTPWAGHYAPELLGQFWQRMATADFPPIHHSRPYAEANTPHYRVVWRKLLVGQPGFP